MNAHSQIATERPWMAAHERDNVGIALVDLLAGFQAGLVQLTQAIPAGHKFALRRVGRGEAITKLGFPIGAAFHPIAGGEHVHDHNLAFVKTDQAEGALSNLVWPAQTTRHFHGFARHDGGVGTRNYIGVIASVNCSVTVVRRIADHFNSALLAPFPMVDGVVAFSHTSGCGMAKSGDGIAYLRRTIAGYARNPNFGGVLIVGLGCEVNQIAALLDAEGLSTGARLRTLTIQESGGTRLAIEAGIAVVSELITLAAQDERSPCPASAITLGLQCGASDGYSALTANPALGRAADLLVGAGGAVILSETPEIYGAEHLLLARAADPDIATRLKARLQWWEEYAAGNGADLDNNPSPGNRAGGITTILEKSLGAVAKSGTSPLRDVLSYAERLRTPGFSFMDTPGYDPCSATGQIAGGANLIAFTTGRGSVFGSKPTPTIKLASNSALARQMPEDIDLDCGGMLTGEATLDEMGHTIFERLIEVASGQKTVSEVAGLGDHEFVPWVPGAMF